jgi:threonine dehydratase
VARALAPRAELFGVEASGFPAVHCALRGRAPSFAAATLADGIAVKEPGALTLPILREQLADVLLVDDGELERAIVALLEIEKTVVEGAGAAPLAAVLGHPERFRGRRVGLVLSGGNIDPRLLAAVIERGLVRSGRLARLRVAMRDRPGALARVAALVAELDANVEEVHHQRAFADLPALSAEVEFVLQTRGPEHVREILAALAAAGFEARAED